MGKKIVVLYSGGLDSFTMLQIAKEDPTNEIICVYYAHGTESEFSEIQLLPEGTLIHHVDWLGVNGLGPVHKPGQENAGAFYIPGRNLVFVTLAACQFLPDEIWLGPTIAEIHEAAVDKNLTFQQMASDMVSYCVSPFVPNGVKIVFPLVDRMMDKDDEIRYLLGQGVLLSEISKRTSSCWHNVGERQCGNCWMCLRRFFYFHQAAGECPDVYATPVLESDFARGIFEEYNKLKLGEMNVDQQSFVDAVTHYESKMGVRLI